jgi:integrase
MSALPRGIDLRPSGKYRVRLMVHGKRVPREFDTVDEAVTARDASYRALHDKRLVPVHGMTLKQAGHAFLAKRKTLRNYATDKSRWNLHVATAPFADRPIQAITRRDILDWRDELEEKETSDRKEARLLSRSVRKHCMNLLRAFLEYCLDRDIIATNPARGVKTTGEMPPIPDDWYLTPAEQEKLLAFDGDEKWIAMFAMGTGLRQAEQWSLRLIDLHVDGDNPHVMVRFGAEGKTPKSKKARVVPLFGIGLVAAREWLKVLPTYAKKNPRGLVFPTRARGSRRGLSKVPEQWSAMVAHIGRHVWWHLLRHTAASSLVAGWWETKWLLQDVREFMGHSSITVTERYAHLAGSTLERLAKVTGVVWSRDQLSPSVPRENQQEDRPSKPNVVCSNQTGRTEVVPSGYVASEVTTQDQCGTTERTAILAWLDGGHRRSPWPGPDESAPHLRVKLLADQIRRGEHLLAGGVS